MNLINTLLGMETPKIVNDGETLGEWFDKVDHDAWCRMWANNCSDKYKHIFGNDTISRLDVDTYNNYKDRVIEKICVIDEPLTSQIFYHVYLSKNVKSK